ncbi:hypothetical protein ACIGBH_40850 [Streptomyces sp. NPDC085929]|uniref:hypothetical protein n=1 Tax=Streptomyces sp. NPDC085929 TaxID=3365739 RepID=UPI0037D7C803
MYSDRVQLTAGERATIDALNASIAADRVPEGYDALTEFRKSLAKETREALGSAIPDLEERGRAQRERITPELERLKGTAWPTHGLVPLETDGLGYHHPLDGPVMLRGPVIQPPPRPGEVFGQPANMGELWRVSSSTFTSEPNLVPDVDQDPFRIFGHLGHAGDALLTGAVGLTMTFILPPERMEHTNRTDFEVFPDLRVNGFVSGWTGFYNWLLAADDKWSKCWESIEATLTLSSGERLTGDSLQENLFFLANVSPVGMANPHRVFGWGPTLRFTANMRDLRQRGVSIILHTALRYDFQLTGESDIWFRNRSGSDSESVPAFDNALTFRCSPGVVTSIP